MIRGLVSATYAASRPASAGREVAASREPSCCASSGRVRGSVVVIASSGPLVARRAATVPPGNRSAVAAGQTPASVAGMSGQRLPVVVVGAGLAGLAAARRLLGRAARSVRARGRRPPGRPGRAPTCVDGFRVDRGFQVLNTGLPRAGAGPSTCAALDLRPFVPGALVRTASGSHLVADPRRHAPGSAVHPAGSGRHAAGQAAGGPGLGRPGRSARRGAHRRRAEHARRAGRAGVCRRGSSRLPAAVPVRCPAGGRAGDLQPGSATWSGARSPAGRSAVPAAGMGAMPRQLADGLPPGHWSATGGGRARRGRGEVWTADGPLAAAAVDRRRRPGDRGPAARRPSRRGCAAVTTWYHAAPRRAVPGARARPRRQPAARRSSTRSC